MKITIITHRYTSQTKALGLDELYMYDLYVPIMETLQLNTTTKKLLASVEAWTLGRAPRNHEESIRRQIVDWLLKTS